MGVNSTAVALLLKILVKNAHSKKKADRVIHGLKPSNKEINPVAKYNAPPVCAMAVAIAKAVAMVKRCANPPRAPLGECSKPCHNHCSGTATAAVTMGKILVAASKIVIPKISLARVAWAKFGRFVADHSSKRTSRLRAQSLNLLCGA